MGIEGSLSGAHRYSGLRAYAYGKVLDLPWPDHPSFPSYGYVITRHDLDAIVNERAVKAGATVWQGTEAVEPLVEPGPATAGSAPVAGRVRHGGCPACVGAVVRDKCHRDRPRGAGPLRGGGRRGQLALRTGPRHRP